MSFEEVLKQSGLKITPQRMAILKEIQRCGHPTIEEIYENILQEHPSISLATIYKNIISLCEVGLLKEVRINMQKQRYEIAHEEHMHTVCVSCGKIEDLEMNLNHLYTNKSVIQKIAPSYIAAVVYGKCLECQKSKK